MTALKSNKKKTGRHIWNYFNTLENDEDFDSLQCFIDECFKRIVMGKPNTVQTPSNKHAPSTKRSGPEDSPEPASPQTSGTVNILQMTDKIIIFLIYGLLNRGGPVQEKCQFFWGQYGFLKGQCVILGREVSLSIVWLDLITNFCRNR